MCKIKVIRFCNIPFYNYVKYILLLEEDTEEETVALGRSCHDGSFFYQRGQVIAPCDLFKHKPRYCCGGTFQMGLSAITSPPHVNEGEHC